MPRLFTGLEIPQEVGLALSLKRGGLYGARWMDPENYHITLRFIGDVDHRTANEVTDALTGCRHSEALASGSTISDRSAATSRGRSMPGSRSTPPLTRLQAAQERVLQMLGLPPEGRKFTPHVSLARLRGTSAEEIARFIAMSGRFQPLEFPVGRFVLFSSKDSVGGGPYLVEQAYPLAA